MDFREHAERAAISLHDTRGGKRRTIFYRSILIQATPPSARLRLRVPVYVRVRAHVYVRTRAPRRPVIKESGWQIFV